MLSDLEKARRALSGANFCASEKLTPEDDTWRYHFACPVSRSNIEYRCELVERWLAYVPWIPSSHAAAERPVE